MEENQRTSFPNKIKLRYRHLTFGKVVFNDTEPKTFYINKAVSLLKNKEKLARQVAQEIKRHLPSHTYGPSSIPEIHVKEERPV